MAPDSHSTKSVFGSPMTRLRQYPLLLLVLIRLLRFYSRYTSFAISKLVSLSVERSVLHHTFSPATPSKETSALKITSASKRSSLPSICAKYSCIKFSTFLASCSSWWSTGSSSIRLAWFDTVAGLASSECTEAPVSRSGDVSSYPSCEEQRELRSSSGSSSSSIFKECGMTLRSCSSLIERRTHSAS
jgi:hypothetical protein